MEVKTLFGVVKTRDSATSMQRSSHVLLKDNPSLKPLFVWLKSVGMRSAEDSKFPRLVQQLEEIRFESEAKFYVNEEVPMIVFHNIEPLHADFQVAVPKYINLFYKALYAPEATIL